MGLDITAFSNVTLINRHPDQYAEDNGNVTYCNPDFPGREGSIVDRAEYVAKDEFHFAAGSYSNYNHWRDQLAQLIGFPDAETVWNAHQQGVIDLDQPFVALINFADNEGIIGPEYSAKLALHFAEYDDKAKEVGDYFYKKYQNWRRAFEMAAQNGYVDFH